MSSRSMLVWLVCVMGIVASPVELRATEKILIPVFLGERNPGGFGFAPHVKGWITSAFVANRSTEPVVGGGVWFSVHCGIPEGCATSAVPPEMIGEIFAPVSEAGLVLEVPASESVSVAAWASRWPSESATTSAQLPVAREREFVSRPLQFLAVPIGLGAQGVVRVHLRVYSLVEESVRVRVEMRDYYSLAGPVHETHEVDLRSVPTPGPSQFAFIDLVAQFPRAGAHTSLETVTVVPLPAADGTVPAIWAFISVTSSGNEIRIMPPA